MNSRPLGNDSIDGTGSNKGFYELAAGADVCAYFDEVMQQQLLPTDGHLLPDERAPR